VTSNLPIIAGLVFFEGNSSAQISQAGVQAATPLTRQAILAVRFPQQNTGVAVAYPGTDTANITFQLVDKSGAPIVPQVTKQLAANNQSAFFISDLFPNAPAIIFGTMRIISDKPIVSTALLVAEPQGLLATVPIIPLQ
jgi:hypothetical protein